MIIKVYSMLMGYAYFKDVIWTELLEKNEKSILGISYKARIKIFLCVCRTKKKDSFAIKKIKPHGNSIQLIRKT